MNKFLAEAKKNIFTALGMVLIIFASIIIISLFTPQRRYDRAVLKAQKAYANQKFDAAVTAFEKAIDAKNNYPEAYLGLLLSKEALQAEDLKETYIAGLEAFEKFNDEAKEAMQAEITEYVLHESVVFADDIDARIDALEKGCEVSHGAEDVRRILRECELEKIDILRNGEQYEEALSLIERLELRSGIKKSDYEEGIHKEKAFSETKKALLIRVYNALKDVAFNDEKADPFSYSFDEISEIDGSNQANEVSSSFLSDSYKYIVDGDSNTITGKGSGLYTFGEKYRTDKGGVAIPYYFYVGNFVNGKRDGFGISFTKTGNDAFVLYAGEWKDDLPEGEGYRFEKSKDTENDGSVCKKTSGSWLKGMAEGDISVEVREDAYPGDAFKGVLKAKEGKCTPVPTETADYVVLNLRTGKLIGVLASEKEGYGLMIALWQSDSEVMSAMAIN